MKNTKIAIVMDPVEGILMDQDTTFALALEAQSRGAKLYVFYLEDLLIKHAMVMAYGREIEFQRANLCFTFKTERKLFDLEDFDYLLMRKDPPFDEPYFFATHFLSLLKKPKVINRQKGLREAPEKLYALNFPQILPPSLISSKAEEIRQFMIDQGGEIIIKPLNQCGGAGILYLHEGDKNFHSIMEMSTNEGKDWIVAQKYLKEIKQGDKRIILINGKPAGAISRIPKEDEHRGNIHVGGQVFFAPITKRDLWLIEQIEQQLRKDGLYFVGLDVIGDFVTEINVTSPTGVQEIQRLGQIDVAKIFWDEIKNFAG